MTKTIVSCTFEEQLPLIDDECDALDLDVHVVYDDGSREKLFSTYSGFLNFTKEELIGLTREEAKKRAKAR